MTAARQSDLEVLDTALTRLRRFSEAAPVLDDRGSRVELSTLLVLDALTGADEAVSVREVAQRLDVAHSTASRFVTRAEQVGAVTRSPCATDRRTTVVEPTAAGRALADRGARFRLARLARITDTWPPEDVTALAGLLDRFVTDHLADPAQPGTGPDD